MRKLTATIVIPARLDSKRLPRKVLLDDTGLPLICHTIAQAKRCKAATHVVVATDSMEVAEAVKGEVPVWCNRDDSWCGTQRAARALIGLPDVYADVDIVVNWQADEPELDPVAVDSLIEYTDVYSPERFTVGTIVGPEIDGIAKREDVTKAITARTTRVVDFKRIADEDEEYFPHIGVYAMRPEFLAELVLMAPSVRSVAESLEQLTWLDEGWSMGFIPAREFPEGINTNADYARFCRRIVGKDPR